MHRPEYYSPVIHVFGGSTGLKFLRSAASWIIFCSFRGRVALIDFDVAMTRYGVPASDSVITEDDMSKAHEVILSCLTMRDGK